MYLSFMFVSTAAAMTTKKEPLEEDLPSTAAIYSAGMYIRKVFYCDIYM